MKTVGRQEDMEKAISARRAAKRPAKRGTYRRKSALESTSLQGNWPIAVTGIPPSRNYF